MISSSGLDGLLADVQEARRLVGQLRQVRALADGSLLSIGNGSGTGALDLEVSALGLALPAGMVADGLAQQLRLAVERLAAGGVRFDEADPADLPQPPAKRGRPKKAVAP